MVAVLAACCALACAAEPETPRPREERLDLSAGSALGLDPVALSRCLGTMEQSYGGSEYDSFLILSCNEAQCGGLRQADTLALFEANEHRIVNVLASFSSVVIDVGSPEQVFAWACRYALDPVFHSAFGEGFPNLRLPL